MGTPDATTPAAGTRPPVSVCIPFFGTADDVRELLDALAVVRYGPDDEVVIADNTDDGVVAAVVAERGEPRVRSVRATKEHSSYHARNVAARAARHDWLLFTDSDCQPWPSLIEGYFTEPVGEDVGYLVGPVWPREDQEGWVAHYAMTRTTNKQEMHLRNRYKPFGVTANICARRAAWESVGGFHEGIRSGGDCDFGWRVQDAGWRLEYRAEPGVAHDQRETLKAVWRVNARYGAGRRWLNVRHPRSRMRPKVVRPVARCLAAAGYWTVQGRWQKAFYKLVDASVISSEVAGALLANRPPPMGQLPEAPPDALRVAVLADAFPEVSETFIAAEVRALARQGLDVRIEAGGRARRPDLAQAEGLRVDYIEDDAPLQKLADLAWLWRRAPRACVADLRDRRRWAAEDHPLPLRSLAPVARRVAGRDEQHLHAHFAAGAALTALRVHRLIGVPYSVTAHGYDIFSRRMNLTEKLAGAAFATTGSDFTLAELRRHAGPAEDRLHRIVMGVDGEVWRRTTPPSQERLVVAVGRLVEKKGFATLVAAAAELPGTAVVIAGEGSLRADLEAQVAELGLADRVTLPGALPSAEVRALLERAAVVCIPAVIAASGDADSMPVIAKEALAMEVPVVASDVAGLPEVVRDEWGRLVAPGDAPALAAALRELLDLSVADRAALGAAGRAFVTGDLGLDAQTATLAGLIRAAARGDR